MTVTAKDLSIMRPIRRMALALVALYPSLAAAQTSPEPVEPLPGPFKHEVGGPGMGVLLVTEDGKINLNQMPDGSMLNILVDNGNWLKMNVCIYDKYKLHEYEAYTVDNWTNNDNIQPINTNEMLAVRDAVISFVADPGAATQKTLQNTVQTVFNHTKRCQTNPIS